MKLSLVKPFVLGVLVRYRWALLGAALVLTLLAAPLASRLTWDHSIESLFAKDDPLLQDYQLSQELFGAHEFCIVAYTDPDLFTPHGMKHLADLGRRLGRDPKFDQVISLANKKFSLGSTVLETLTRDPDQADAIRQAVLATEPYRGILLGRDGQTTAIFLRLCRDTSSADLRDVVQNVRRQLADEPLPAHVVGPPVMVSDIFRYLEEDGRVFKIVSTVLLVLVMAVLFRSIKWILVALAVVQGTLVWTQAIFALAHTHMTLVSSPLSALVTVIGIATVVHLAVRYRDERATHGASPEEARDLSLSHVGPACFWTSVTTAAGFGALCVSQIVPVRQFGLMMALGAALVCVLAVILTAALATVGERRWETRTLKAEERLSDGLSHVSGWVRGHAWTVSLTSVAVFSGAFLGIVRLQALSNFSHNFRKGSPIVASYTFVESRLTGAGPMEVVLPCPDLLAPGVVEKLRETGRRLRRLKAAPKVLGLVDLLDLVAQKADKNPLGRWLSPRVRLRLCLELLKKAEPDLVGRLWNPDRGFMRILIFSRESATGREKQQFIGEVRRVARDVLGPDAKVSGLLLMFHSLVSSLMADQARTFLLAVVCICVMLILAFRSLRLGLLALVPNACPIIIVLGLMGWSGLPINIGTAMIASVSMGMAVDSSIHYIRRYVYEREHGADPDTAVRRTHATVGRALVFANIAILIGFSVLCLSNFVPTIHFGILVGVAMLGGLAGNLFLLPLLLRLWSAREAPPTPAPPGDDPPQGDSVN